MDPSIPHLNSPRQITNDEVEAVIKMATSSRSAAGSVKDTRTQLFVGNLPYRVRWQDLKDLFRRAGTVLRADVSLGPDNRSRGYGTVLLGTAEDAGRAIDMFNGYSWQSRVLEVRPDRLPPDFDVNIQPSFSSAAAAHLGVTGRPFEVLDYSTLLDLQNSLPSLPSRNLFVGNLPFHCQWQDLKDLFRQAGTIIRADVALSPEGRSRGFGTVSFATEQDAERAVKMFNSYEYNGRALKVNFDRFAQITGGATQLQQSSSTPSALTSATVSALASPASNASGLEAQLLMPAALHPSSIKPSSAQSTGYRLDLNPSTSSSPSPYDAWSSATSPVPSQNAREDPDQELLRSLGRLDIDSRSVSSLLKSKLQQSQPPSATRSTSGSSSDKPPSLRTTTSGSSVVSTSSSVAASVSTSNTSEKSTPPQVPPISTQDRHLSFPSSSLHSLLHSSASSSVPSSPVAQHASQSPIPTPLQPSQPPVSPRSSGVPARRQLASSKRTTSSQSLHPRHPGPIALPPRPNAFPAYIHTNMSPGHFPGVSPLHHPLGSPTQQMFHPGAPHLTTPHGLPPMTPSMPPFNFHPPAPLASPSLTAPLGSPGIAPLPPTAHVYRQAYPMSSPVLAIHPIHMQPQMIQPSPLHHPAQQSHHHAPFGITPISPAQHAHANVHTPIALVSFSDFRGGGNGGGQGHSGNGNGGERNNDDRAAAAAAAANEAMNQQATAMAMYPYTHGVAFSPGVMMSPGAVWTGQRTAGANNPMMNPAVGGPVHFMHQMREPSGYFEGYFPPVQQTQAHQQQQQSGSTLVENEILKNPVSHGTGTFDSSQEEHSGEFWYEEEVAASEVLQRFVGKRPVSKERKQRRHSSTTTSSSETLMRPKRNSRGSDNEESAITDSEEGSSSIARAHSMKNPPMPRAQSDPNEVFGWSGSSKSSERDDDVLARHSDMPSSAQ